MKIIAKKINRQKCGQKFADNQSPKVSDNAVFWNDQADKCQTDSKPQGIQQETLVYQPQTI